MDAAPETLPGALLEGDIPEADALEVLPGVLTDAPELSEGLTSLGTLPENGFPVVDGAFSGLPVGALLALEADWPKAGINAEAERPATKISDLVFMSFQ